MDLNNLNDKQLAAVKSVGQPNLMRAAAHRVSRAEPRRREADGHNVREALEICDHAIVINNGSIIAKGDKNSLINDEMVKKVYLGDMYS